MERPLTLKPLRIQDENTTFNRTKPTVDDKSKNSKPVAKKGGVALESRKALNDITNKKSTCREASSQNKSSKESKCNTMDNGYMQHSVFEAELLSKKSHSLIEKLNIAEEGFLHDHRKCVQAQKATSELDFWDLVLPGHGSIRGNTILPPISDFHILSIQHNPDITRKDWCLKLEELSMPEFSEPWYKSPPSSPPQWDSPTSPFAWDLEPIELTLKEYDS